MSEHKATDTSQQGQIVEKYGPGRDRVDRDLLAKTTKPLSYSGVLSSAHEGSLSLPLLEHAGRTTERVPAWLRPFLSLRVQLVGTYGIIMALVAASICILFYQHKAGSSIGLDAAVVVIIGTLLTFAITTLLLRPLWQVTDAAQAIAVGDFAQRERLPLRLPPQDEIDRLAGSLNELAHLLESSEERARAQEQRSTRFFSDASHQLRTPLTSIRGFTEILLRGASEDPETAQHILKRMKGEGERMTALINDLLTLARLDDANQLKLQYVDLTELAQESVNQSRKQIANNRTITLSIEDSAQPGLRADRERLKQLLFILLDNAIKHGRQGDDGFIDLRLHQRGKQVTIQVIDNGEGISQEDLGHVFESFYRGTPRQSTKTPVPGMGLGLTIAAAIVRAHQGTIVAGSKPDQGTTVTVVLPCLNQHNE